MPTGSAGLAQTVEQRTENPCVPSSILGAGTQKNPSRFVGTGFFRQKETPKGLLIEETELFQ